MTSKKMKVEIWSDVMCPFCYIGKRKFEAALSTFKNRGDLEIIWKSFQLAPELASQPDKNMHQFLAEHKGISIAQATEMNNRVSKLASQVGLTYNFDKAVIVNSYKAHRFSHFAKEFNLQEKAEEALFHAYFTAGRNIDDIETLVLLGEEIGLAGIETRKVLESNRYTDEVSQDMYEAREIGVSGVPFFVFDRKVAISGAQESPIFLEILEKSFEDWRMQNPKTSLEKTDG